MHFKQFADAVNKKFLSLGNELFVVNINKDTLWQTYLNSYTEEENPIFRERKVHECNTCCSFIKRIGHVVAITPTGLDSIWNIENVPAPYDRIAAILHNLVINSSISGVFATDERLAGKEYNIEDSESGPIKWEHFYADISAFKSNSAAATIGEAQSTVSVFRRALEEFDISTLDTVLDLCDSIYRGTEFKPVVEAFKKAKIAYESAENKTNFIWKNYNKYPASIRNSAIGTLIVDIAEGTDLETAVSKYEVKVAPTNYKRTTAVVTENMKKQALKVIEEQGIEDSLARRHARLEDISINNVLWANSDATSVMKSSVASILNAAIPVKVPTNTTTVGIEDFLKNILPTAKSIEALVENRHLSNFVSLVAPVNPDAPNILKWDNNFSWSYNGEVTDSIKERVKEAGGKVDSVMRFSIQWNEDNKDTSNDLDAHCTTKSGKHIYFSNKSAAGGQLDIDIRRPGNKVAVENIVWVKTPNDDTYTFYVHNFSGANTNGFKAQIEVNGEIFEYTYNKKVNSGGTVNVASVTIKNGKHEIKHLLSSEASKTTVWDIDTLAFKPVSTVMLSPNFWDDNASGNKHYFFMLENCKNPDSVRGFYNEFLNSSLTPHKKVFETLSSLMKCEYDEHQLSGIGFSSTMSNTLTVKIDGKQIYTITF